MLARFEGSTWEVRAPAKLNLLFEIFAKRNDGYHEIETVMVPITMFDTLRFRSQSAGPIEFSCAWAGRELARASGPIPEDSRNLVVKAVELLRARSGCEAGARLWLTKRIPAEAGLGGGSSDAAAALIAANRGWRLNWPLEKLALLAAELGSDVPFFLQKGAAICRGRGEQVEPIGPLPRLHLVVVRPPEGLSTAQVYAHCRPARQPKLAAPLVEQLRQGKLAHAARLMHNRLQAAATQLSPWVRRLEAELNRVDCLGHQMSGSGTSYFGVCYHARHAQQVAQRLRSRGLGLVYAASTYH